MNKLTNERRTQVIKQLCEGASIRSTVRLTGVAKNTIVKLLREIAIACNQYQDKTLRNLPCKRVQSDEIWSFCYAKDKNVPADKRGQFGYGDVWTWTAICSETKLIASWMVGRRDAGTAHEFMQDLAGRLAHRVQLTTVRFSLRGAGDLPPLVLRIAQPRNTAAFRLGNFFPGHVFIVNPEIIGNILAFKASALAPIFSRLNEILRVLQKLFVLDRNFCRVASNPVFGLSLWIGD